jgi:hypothetical protein
MRTAFVRGAALASAVFASAVPNAAMAGYRIVQQDGDTLLVSGGRYKSVAKDPGKPLYVLDVNRGRMLMSAPSAKSYWEGTVEEFCKEFPKALEQSVAQATKEMERQQQAELAKLTPTERAKRAKAEAEVKKWAEEMNTPAGQAKAKREMKDLAKKMGVDPKDLDEPADRPVASGAVPKVNVDRTGETSTVAGITARKFRVTVDGEPYEDHWLATDQALLRELAWDRLARVVERFQSCLDASSDKARAHDIEETKEYRQLQAQGFPLKIVSYTGGEPDGQVKEQVTSAERRDIPDGEFAAPAGFKKTSLSGLSSAWMTAGSQQEK